MLRSPSVIVGFLLLVAALGMHVFTIGRIATWQSGYPQLLELGPLSPPPLMHRLHLAGPVVAVGALLLAVVGAWLRARGKALAMAGTGLGISILVVLLLLYAWSTIWVLNVSQQIARAGA